MLLLFCMFGKRNNAFVVLLSVVCFTTVRLDRFMSSLISPTCLYAAGPWWPCPQIILNYSIPRQVWFTKKSGQLLTTRNTSSPLGLGISPYVRPTFSLSKASLTRSHSSGSGIHLPTIRRVFSSGAVCVSLPCIFDRQRGDHFHQTGYYWEV